MVVMTQESLPPRLEGVTVDQLLPTPQFAYQFCSDSPIKEFEETGLYLKLILLGSESCHITKIQNGYTTETRIMSWPTADDASRLCVQRTFLLPGAKEPCTTINFIERIHTQDGRIIFSVSDNQGNILPTVAIVDFCRSLLELKTTLQEKLAPQNP